MYWAEKNPLNEVENFLDGKTIKRSTVNVQDGVGTFLSITFEDNSSIEIVISPVQETNVTLYEGNGTWETYSL